MSDHPGGTARANPSPVSRRVAVVASAVLGLTLAAIVADTRRVRTGELLVQSDRGDLRLTIRRDGRLVEGPTARRSLTLRPGVYDIEIDGEPSGRVSVVRAGRTVFKVAEPPRNARPSPEPARLPSSTGSGVPAGSPSPP